jgi:hypothetical protein
VEVPDANIVTLFTPRASSSPVAWYVQVDCSELEIAEIPHDACPLRLHLRRRYGPNVQLGEITGWEDRNRPAAAPRFNRGGTVYHATFSKPGSQVGPKFAIRQTVSMRGRADCLGRRALACLYHFAHASKIVRSNCREHQWSAECFRRTLILELLSGTTFVTTEGRATMTGCISNTWSRIVPLGTGCRLSSASTTERCVRAPEGRVRLRR